MALPNTRLRTFTKLSDLLSFIQTDNDITTVIQIFTDNNGNIVLVYATA